jgi:hypothetical protein
MNRVSDPRVNEHSDLHDTNTTGVERSELGSPTSTGRGRAVHKSLRQALQDRHRHRHGMWSPSRRDSLPLHRRTGTRRCASPCQQVATASMSAGHPPPVVYSYRSGADPLS